MKRRILLLLSILMLCLLLTALVACGDDEEGEGTTAPVTTAPVTTVPPTLALEALSSYEFVYPTDVDMETFEALIALRDAITAETGVTLRDKEDFVAFDEELPVGTLEILVGATNRPESASHKLGRDDTGIYFENGRLVISGGTPSAVIEALGRFTETYVKDGKVYYPTSPDLVRGTYPYASATINGVDIYEFAIVRDALNSTLANVLASYISEATGAMLPILKPNSDAAAYEIIVGSRGMKGDRVPPTVTDGKWFAEMKGNRLYLSGTGEDGDYAAVMSLISKLTGSGESLAISYATPETDSVRDMSMYTLNLPDTLGSMQGKYDIAYSTETVLSRFLAARDELPTEVTVIERVESSRYPLACLRTLYVSPTGSDEAAGTLAAPLATLDEALSRMENAGGGVIFMMGGTYAVTDTIEIKKAHSGLRQAPLFIKAYEDEEVILTSNKQLDTSDDKWFYLEGSDELYDRIPEDARPFIKYTTLDLQGWTVEDIPDIVAGASGGAPSLYVGGDEYVMARFPNETIDNRELLYFTHAYDTGTVTTRDGSDLYFTWVERAERNGWDPKTKIVGWEVRVINERDNKSDKYSHWEYGDEILSWVNTGDIWYYGSCFEGWEFGYYNLALETEGEWWAHNEAGEEYDPATDEVAYLGYPKGDGYYSIKSMTNNSWGCKVSGNSSAGRNTFYLFNAIEALDAPGEWFLDKETGVLYIYPEDAHYDLSESGVSIANSDKFDLVSVASVSNLVIDGITFDGSSKNGLYMNGGRNIVIQNCTFRNTRNCNLSMTECLSTALIYNDFSAAYSTMLNVQNSSSALSLTPTNNVIQNNIFHDPMPLKQSAIAWGGCRLVISHNYFNNTTTQGSSGVECIIEYNRFEGGSKDITDGGFIYASGATCRQNHYRYNLFHMFNATHNAIYNDTMGSGNYSYYNVISTLHSASDHNKSWYSSTGWGNVHYGNIQILRNPVDIALAGGLGTMESEEGVFNSASKGDMLNESALFYYYFGDEHAATTNRAWNPVDYEGNSQGGTLSQSLAGHWWVGMKKNDVTRYLTNAKQLQWKDRAPEYINMMYGTRMILEVWDAVAAKTCDYHIKHFYVPWYETGKSFTFKVATKGGSVPLDAVITVPSYQYLETDGTLTTVDDYTFTAASVADPDTGEFTLTYEQIASMERARRAPMYSVVMNNVILGGTPIYEKVGNTYEIPEDAQPNRAQLITTSSDSYKGFYKTLLNTNNYMSYLYDDIVPGARDSFDYAMTDAGWAMIEAAGAEDATLTVEPSLIPVLRELAGSDTVAGLWRKTGPTYDFNYGDWFDDVYPDFYE